MPQSCSVCRHAKRSAIENALVRNTPLRAVAREFQTSPAALHRHIHGQHIARTLMKAQRAREASEASSLLSRVEELIPQLRQIASSARRAREWQAATGAIREMRGCLQLLAQLSGELRAAGDVHIHRHAHAHLHGNSEPGAMSDSALEFEIAKDVQAATANFSPTEIARLKALVESLPVPQESGLLLEA